MPRRMTHRSWRQSNVTLMLGLNTAPSTEKVNYHPVETAQAGLRVEIAAKVPYEVANAAPLRAAEALAVRDADAEARRAAEAVRVTIEKAAAERNAEEDALRAARPLLRLIRGKQAERTRETDAHPRAEAVAVQARAEADAGPTVAVNAARLPLQEAAAAAEMLADPEAAAGRNCPTIKPSRQMSNPI